MISMPNAGWMRAVGSLARLWRSAQRHADRPFGHAVMTGSRPMEELRAEARYARERYDLYRAKMYGLRPTSITRFRELERIHQGADARLRRAQQEHPPDSPG